MDVDDDCLGDKLLGGHSVAAGLVPDLGRADFRGFGVGFALGLGVDLGFEGKVVELGSDAFKRACADDGKSIDPPLASMLVSGC